jgi:hypothetical protein
MRVKPAAPARVATDKKIAATGRRCDQIRHARSLFPLTDRGQSLVVTVAARRELPELSDGDLKLLQERK